MVRRILPIVLLLAFAGAACGDEARRALASERPDCKPAAQRGGETLFLCWRPNRPAEHGRLVLVAEDTQQTINARPPGGVGHWAGAELSPDGQTILAQWSAECEVPVAYLIPVAGGRPYEAIPRAYASRALGWTDDDRAAVRVLGTACGPSAPKAGIYLVDPDGKTSGPFDRVPD